MQHDRVLHSDPDSVAFVNAAKALKKRGKTLRGV